jgi:hypothetical protein
MPKTISQVLGFVDQMIPNAVDTTTKMIFIEDIFKDIREYNTEYVVSDTTPTASSQATYSLPTGIRWKDLIFVGISPTTFNTSNVVASTTPFVEYLYKTKRNEETGLQWWEYTSTAIRLSSIPDDAYHMQFRYLPGLTCNATSDSTTVIPANDYMCDYIQNKLAVKIAKFGTFPRVDMSNNYELDSMELLTKIKIESKKMYWRRLGYAVSYKDWW